MSAARFQRFACHALSSVAQVPARHHELLIARLQDVADGRCDRLMVQMPPGSAKSTYGSVLFPAYFLGLHKRSQIIAIAHTASLAGHFGRLARNIVVEYGDLLDLKLTRESSAATRFMTEAGGEYFAAGVRGPITGRRADLIIIDDPVKSWAEAESQIYRDALYDWYRAELSARLKPGGRIVLIMTRWHEDDLAGRLLRGNSDWCCLKLSAIATTNDPLGRNEGAALWPELQDAAAISRRRLEVGERTFAAMYQQNPRPPHAALFKTDNINLILEVPHFIRTVRAWDLASSLSRPGRNPDYTVGLKLGVTAEQNLIVVDVIRIQESPARVEAKIQATARNDGVTTILALPQDPGQAGAAQIAMLSRGLLGFHVVATPETGAKLLRAMPAATQIDAGSLFLLAAPWNDAFLAELREFPDSPKDDQVDALSRAVNTLATTGSQITRRVNIPLLGR